MKAYLKKYELQFKRPVRTSRGELQSRPVWFLILEKNGLAGVGECAPLPGLSKETPGQVEQLLEDLCSDPVNFLWSQDLTSKIASVHFALETAWFDLKNGGNQRLFSSDFSNGKAGIPINGLVWMGSADFMLKQVHEKLKAGYRCIKLKIGGINFEKELEIIRSIRNIYDENKIILRLDANGAFKPETVLEKLQQLAALQIHSIEQPIAAGQWENMASICCKSPISVALDEELIGIHSIKEKERLLDIIKPAFLILKPSLHGGFSGCNEWIELAEPRSIKWWITSYLESNIGLNAIAQWTFSKNANGYQGLGTGALFTNNISSPLEVRGDQLWFNDRKAFQFPKNFFIK